METQTDSIVYVTRALYSEINEHVLVMACSDPRYQLARKEFIEEHFGLTRYDPVIDVGGPANLLLTTPYYFATRKKVAMLNAAHELRRAIMFAHADCRFYRSRYVHLDPEKLRAKQWSDLRQARRDLCAMISGIAVKTFYAEPSANGRVQFVLID